MREKKPPNATVSRPSKSATFHSLASVKMEIHLETTLLHASCLQPTGPTGARGILQTTLTGRYVQRSIPTQHQPRTVLARLSPSSTLIPSMPRTIWRTFWTSLQTVMCGPQRFFDVPPIPQAHLLRPCGSHHDCCYSLDPSRFVAGSRKTTMSRVWTEAVEALYIRRPVVLLRAGF